MLETCKANGLLPASPMNAGNEQNDFCAIFFCAASFLPLRIYFFTGMLCDASGVASQPTPLVPPSEIRVEHGFIKGNHWLISP